MTCKAIEDMLEEAVHNECIRIAERMLKNTDKSVEEIADLVEIPVEEVVEISNHLLKQNKEAYDKMNKENTK